MNNGMLYQPLRLPACVCLLTTRAMREPRGKRGERDLLVRVKSPDEDYPVTTVVETRVEEKASSS